MSIDLYFFDQYSRTSRIGGIHRFKRDLNDFNEALYHVKAASALEDNHLPMTIKKRRNGIPVEPKLYPPRKPILPEILTKELDTILQTFDEESKTTSPSSIRSKSPENKINNEKQLIHPASNLPKVSLPAALIVQLHATWSDLIQNTNYKCKVWRTKAGEEAWRRHVQRKRSEQFNTKKQKDSSDEKLVIRRRTSSRVSISSTSHLSHRQSIITNSKTRFSRAFSRASIFSTSSIVPDHLRLLKSMHQGPSETIVEPIKNGIHVEFKLSTQDEETKQKIVLFDVPKPDVNFDKDAIIFAQNKCKRLLAEAKQNIRETTYDRNKKQANIDRIWFYEENQHMRNRSRCLTSNQSNRRQTKSKFALSILRHEIPETFNVDIDKPETKQKCYVQLTDGSTHIYYPSGRLAVLRLRSTISTTLFFDDSESSTHQFLGLVTSTGNVLLMQPTFHACFITNNQHENGYLCNGKTGIIEKHFQCSSSNDQLIRRSLPIDEENTNRTVLDNTVQFQINSYMQLEYSNSSNIRFAFNCQNEEFKLQLGSSLPRQSSLMINSTSAVLPIKKLSIDQKSQTPTKRTTSISSNDEKQQIQTSKLPDEQTWSHQLPIMDELIQLRIRIKDICHNWLKECRTTLGIMHLDAYHLPDLPLQSTVTQINPQINDINRSKSAKEHRPQTSLNNKFVQSLDRQQFLLPNKLESNVIANAIEQFVPRSDTGRSVKQQIYRKKILPTTLPVIK